jgi:hypothetical protein
MKKLDSFLLTSRKEELDETSGGCGVEILQEPGFADAPGRLPLRAELLRVRC